MDYRRSTHQLPRHDLALVHEVKDETILLPVDSMNLPGQLAFALAFMLFIDCLLHLTLKIQDHFFNKLPTLQLIIIAGQKGRISSILACHHQELSARIRKCHHPALKWIS